MTAFGKSDNGAKWISRVFFAGERGKEVKVDTGFVT